MLLFFCAATTTFAALPLSSFPLSSTRLARSPYALLSIRTLFQICAWQYCRVSRWLFHCSTKPMQWQSSVSSLSTNLTLVRMELKDSCCCSLLLKTRWRLSWYSCTSSAKKCLDFQFSAESSWLLVSSSFSLRIFSPMYSIFSYRNALFSVKIYRSCEQSARVCSRFRVINLSQKELSSAGGTLISLRASIGPSSFDLESSRERDLLSSWPAFSYSSSDYSSTKVLLCRRVFSSAYLAYFLLRTLSRSGAFLSPNFELRLIAIII